MKGGVKSLLPSHQGSDLTRIAFSSKTNYSGLTSHIDLIKSLNTISGLSKQDPQT